MDSTRERRNEPYPMAFVVRKRIISYYGNTEFTSEKFTFVTKSARIGHQFVNAMAFLYMRSRLSYSEKERSFNSIPGPVSVPFFGVLPHFFRPIGTFSYRMSALQFSEKLFSTYGEVVRFSSVLGKKPTVFILTPELAEEVYKQQLTRRDLLESMVYFRREMRSDDFRGQHGTLASDGAEWRATRRAADTVMLSERAIVQHHPEVNRVSDRAMDCIATAWEKKDEEGFSDSLYKIVRSWSLEALGSVTYGHRLGALDTNSSRQKRCDTFLDCLNRMLESIFSLQFGLSLWKYLTTRSFKRAVDAYDAHLEFVKEFAQESSASTTERRERAGECWLDKLTRSAPDMTLGVTSDIMLAGIDTVAQTTISILYVLASNVEEQDRLRVQLRSEGDSKRYLRAYIKEALRVLPTTGGNYRTTGKDIIVGGYHIPKNVDIVLCHQYMSAQEEQFPRAREFLPSRWLPALDPAHLHDPLGSPPDAPSAHPSAYMPFGSGARGCPGRTLALLEMESFLQHFVTRFSMRWDAPPPRFDNPTVNFLVQPYGFVLEMVRD